MNSLRNLLFIVWVLPALGCAAAQQGAARPVLSATAAEQAPAEAVPSQQTGPLSVSPSYIIGADDQIKIDVREVDKDGNLQLVEDESASEIVRPDGKITLPLINDIQAAGFTPIQLAKNIGARLTQQVYKDDPTVTVTVIAVNSKHVYMVGEVSRAGLMQITPGLTILQAIASAGLSPYANKKHIYILRGDPNNPTKVMFDYNKALKKGDMQGISLLPGDTIVVP
jgi:polysaccharide export outer membrane protein